MAKFLVLYRVPNAVIERWRDTDAASRAPAEQKMRDEWNAWMRRNGAAVTDTQAAGKSKAVTPDGVSDTKNDIMLTALVEAESLDAAASLFKDHPHLGIPQSSIEVMETRPMG